MGPPAWAASSSAPSCGSQTAATGRDREQRALSAARPPGCHASAQESAPGALLVDWPPAPPEQTDVPTVPVPAWPGAGPYPGFVRTSTTSEKVPLISGPDWIT